MAVVLAVIKSGDAVVIFVAIDTEVIRRNAVADEVFGIVVLGRHRLGGNQILLDRIDAESASGKDTGDDHSSDNDSLLGHGEMRIETAYMESLSAIDHHYASKCRPIHEGDMALNDKVNQPIIEARW